jgi:hypothetical protein
MSDPWAFGWTQLLTIIGFIITVAIAIGGFGTFGRWKREKLEEKRIDTAIETLALVYESKSIFDHIRNEMSFGYEWQDMPEKQGESEQLRNARAPFYAILKRIEASKDFFDRAWKLQVRCMALFGPEVEETFLLLQRARREIEVSAGMLLQDPEPQNETKDNLEFRVSLRADVWAAYGKLAKKGDQVGKKLSDFRERIEGLCRPTINRAYVTTPSSTMFGSIADWFKRHLV